MCALYPEISLQIERHGTAAFFLLRSVRDAYKYVSRNEVQCIKVRKSVAVSVFMESNLNFDGIHSIIQASAPPPPVAPVPALAAKRLAGETSSARPERPQAVTLGGLESERSGLYTIRSVRIFLIRTFRIALGAVKTNERHCTDCDAM